MPRLMVEFADERDLGGSLQEIQGLHARVDGEARNARRPTSLSRDEWNFPRQHFIVGLFHLLNDPGPQNRIAEVRDPIGRLNTTAVRDVGVVLCRHHRPWPAEWRQE